jgi:uncharacterized membrane protein YwzB
MQPRHNYYAIALCAVINFIFANTWFGPLFGDKWFAIHGIVMDKANQTFTKDGITPDFNPILVILSAVVGAILSAFLLSYLFSRIGISGWKDGLLTGAVIGLFTLITVGVNNLFSCNPMALTLIDGGAAIVLFGLYGALLGGWQRK